MSDLRMANIEKLTREIEALLSGAGETVAPQAEDRDATWEVRVADDRLAVFLDMYPAVGNGLPPDPQKICDELETMGVRAIDRDRVMALSALCDSGYPASGEDAARQAMPLLLESTGHWDGRHAGHALNGLMNVVEKAPDLRHDILPVAEKYLAAEKAVIRKAAKSLHKLIQKS